MANFFTRMFTKSMFGKAKKVAVGAAATAATAGIASVLGLDAGLVSKVLALGGSMMAMVGAKDEGVAGKLLGRSKQPGRKKKRPGKAEAEKDFFDVFGAVGKQMTKIISRETDATEDEVGGILGMFLPDFEEAIGEAEPEDEKALQRMFGNQAEEAERDDPLFAKLAKEIVF